VRVDRAKKSVGINEDNSTGTIGVRRSAGVGETGEGMSRITL